MRGREEEGEREIILSSDFPRASVLYHKTVFMRNRGAPTPRLRPVGLRTGTISLIHGDKVHNLLASSLCKTPRLRSQAHFVFAFSTHPWRRSLCTLPGSESAKFLWFKEASGEDPPKKK